MPAKKSPAKSKVMKPKVASAAKTRTSVSARSKSDTVYDRPSRDMIILLLILLLMAVVMFASPYVQR